MDKRIERIIAAAPDYRISTCYNLNEEIITNWINQFEETDKNFILDETAHILEKRYISKDEATQRIDILLNKIKDHYEYKKIENLLTYTKFLKIQPNGKSQHDVMELLENLLTNKYGIDKIDEQPKDIKYILYVDDIMCTGNTAFLDIENCLKRKYENSTVLEWVKKNKVEIILLFIVSHQYNLKKLLNRLINIDKSFDKYLIFTDDKYIVNNDYENSKSELNFIFPIDGSLTADILKLQKQISKNVDQYAKKNGYEVKEEHYVRKKGMPKKELLFTSPVNRIKYESIILSKSYGILKKVISAKKNMLPLGYSLPSFKSFGFGTLTFTWRNIPNNSPLVFWYGAHWHPLFDKKS